MNSKKKRISKVMIDLDNPSNIEINILKLLDTNNHCSHYMNNTFYYKSNNLDVCNEVCDLIKLNIPNISDVVIAEFYSYIIRTGAYYNKDKCPDRCVYKNAVVLSEICVHLFKYYLPPQNFIEQIVKIPEFDKCYKSLNENPKFIKYNAEYLDIFINHRLRFSCDKYNDMELVIHIINNIEINKDTILKLVKCSSSPVSHVISGIIDKFNEELTPEYMDEACYGLPYSKKSIISLMNRGLQLNDNNLEIVCRYCNEEAIEYVLETTRLPVTNAHFKAIIQSKKYMPFTYNIGPNFHYFYSYRSHNNHEEWVDAYSWEKLDVLTKYGYKLTRDDIIFSIINKKYIPNIERFDLKLNKEILNLCWGNDFYPAYDFEDVHSSLMELQRLCKTKKHSEIKQYIKKYNLVPDFKCMENASQFVNNNKIYDLLINSGGKVTYNCLKKCVGEFKNNAFLLKLICDYEKNAEEEKLNYLNKIKQLEDQIVSLGGTLNTSQIEDTTDPIKKKTPVKKTVKKAAITKSKIVNENNHDQNNDTNKKDKDDCNTEPDLIKLPITSKNLTEIQVANRYKANPNKKIYDVLKIEKNMNYSDVKKRLLYKIVTENWYVDNNKNLMIIPENVKQILGITDKGFLAFSDVDKLTAMFYI